MINFNKEGTSPNYEDKGLTIEQEQELNLKGFQILEEKIKIELLGIDNIDPSNTLENTLTMTHRSRLEDELEKVQKLIAEHEAI